MGCSSAAISLRGDHFEPEALLLAYVDAGAPAVVGALWDVTDRDCDRASVRAGEAWGLWRRAEEGSATARLLAKKGRQRKGEVETSHSGAREKGRGKGKGVEEGDQASLVEAVRVGRDECYLKYLNGAAMVVYGIPVYLDG
jgi:separase